MTDSGVFEVWGGATRFMSEADVRARSLVSRAEQAAFRAGVDVTREQSAAILSMPQKSDAWRDARRDRIGASSIGDAAGWGYNGERTLLSRLLWGEDRPGEGADAASEERMQYGTDHEDIARDLFVCWLVASRAGALAALPRDVGEDALDLVGVTEEGLLVLPGEGNGWCGSSADGLVRFGRARHYLEIKCPYSRRLYSLKGPALPVAYHCQNTLGMRNQQARAAYASYDGLPVEGAPFTEVFFTVYTPAVMEVQRFAFDAKLWPALEQRARDFYENCYVPRRILQLRGELPRHAIDPPSASCIRLDDGFA